MIVTADASGDFNATSQILRYSALAREVTVPRIPSVSSQILAGAYASSSRYGTSGCTSPTAALEDLENATREVAKLGEELDVVELRLAEETARRRAAEASWKAAEARMEAIEQEVREECCAQMEAALEAERRRWKGAWGEEADRSDERVDKKIEILARGIQIFEDADPTEEEEIARLEEENQRLRAKIEAMEREENQDTPTKQSRVLMARKWESDASSDNISYVK